MKFILAIALFLFAQGSSADTESELKESVLNNLQATEAEDITKVMSTMHSQSPVYVATMQVLNQMFPAYDLKYTLLNYVYIGTDGEYAYAKVKHETKKVSGPAFQNNELEALQVFKRESGAWKLWNQANLSITYQ